MNAIAKRIRIRAENRDRPTRSITDTSSRRAPTNAPKIPFVIIESLLAKYPRKATTAPISTRNRAVKDRIE
jgi:hypothetical protein